MKLTIDRARWQRGDPDKGELLTDNGKMCCLGFLACACGFKEEDIQNQGTPSQVVNDTGEPKLARKHKRVWSTMTDEVPEGTVDVNGDKTENVEEIFVAINDSEKISARRREALLTKEFAKIGVEVEFVGRTR